MPRWTACWPEAALDQVVNAHRMLLAEPVQPPDALLDFHRVPRQVEVDQPMAELQVAAFGAAVREQQRAAARLEAGQRGERRLAH